MKKFILLLTILFVATSITVYGVVSYRTKKIEAEKQNQKYEAYRGRDIPGTALISLINETINHNEKNEIPKDEEGNYIDDGKFSISLTIRFIYKNDYKEIPMEKIATAGTEAFIKPYSTAIFQCTNIEYHEKSNHVKSLTFEEMKE